MKTFDMCVHFGNYLKKHTHINRLLQIHFLNCLKSLYGSKIFFGVKTLWSISEKPYETCC